MIRILKFLKPIRKNVALSVFLMLLSQGMALLLPALMSLIVNNGIGNKDMDYIKRMGLLMFIGALLGVVFSVCNSYCTARLSAQYGRILREQVFLKVEGLSQCDIDKIGASSLITRSTNDVKQLQDFILVMVRMVLSAPVLLIGGTVMALIMNARLAMYIFAVLPVIGGLAALVLKLVKPLFKKRQKLTDRLNHLVREKLSGIRVIRAFNKSGYEDARFDEKNAELADIALRIARIFSVLIPASIVLAFIGVCLLILAAAHNIDAMDATVEAAKIANTIGDLQAFIVYMIMIVSALVMAGAMFVIVPRANISAKRILEVLDLEPEITPPETPVAPDPAMRGTVAFNDVSFAYAGAQDAVLKHVTFTALPGQTTAVIGGTGSGKSTLINLIPRLYDVTEGSVEVDGVNVKQLDAETLYSLIGYIPQTASLFSGTVRENVCFGKPDAADEEVWHALELAQAADFVRALPEGLDSHVSQSGTNLSGGQKQRIAIARALVRRAEIYIFDDSFSALDFKTDAALRLAIKDELKDSSVIVVAQRVGTILSADKIVVLDEGGVAGVGTHDELMETCSVYREIAESQLSPEELSERRATV
ncbi:MAG: ABC transporter ATP-binding protein [Clostridia bacterium]|nr:ABC transporter ATP-binding protein [Clostridia bacterium]